MIKTLRESKAKLSELVERASRGEDVLITVRGEVKARLTSVAKQEKLSMQHWAEELAALQTSVATGKNDLPIEDILSEDREDRF